MNALNRINLNKINIVGRLGQEPDLKYFESGAVKCTFSIAVNRRGKDDEPNWFRCECWSRTAEIAGEYASKGKLVGVSGRLNIDSWEDRSTGQPRTMPKVEVDDLHLLGSRREDEAENFDEF